MSQSTSKQKKRPAPGTAWKKGQSGNPGGRKKGGDSFASVMRHILSMSGPEIAAAYKHHVKEYSKLPQELTLRQLISLRWAESILNEPTPGLLQQMIDRTDGPVPTVHAGDESAPITVKVVYVRRTNGGAAGTSSESSQSEG